MTMSGLPFIIALVVPRLDDFSAKKKIINICNYASFFYLNQFYF